MSDSDSGPKTLGLSLAGSTIMAALLEQLAEKRVLTVPDVRSILQSASDLLANF